MKFLLLILSFWTVKSFGAIDHCYYDYDDFIIVEQGEIKKHFVDDNYFNYNIGCSSKVAAMYDGDDLIIYNGSRFITKFVDDNYSNSLLEVRRNTVAFYDGDDLFVYYEGRVNVLFVDDNYPDAGLYLQKDAGIFYDGDDLYYFCEGKSNKVFADDNQIPRRIESPGHPRRSNSLAVSVGHSLYILQTQTCTLKKTNL